MISYDHLFHLADLCGFTRREKLDPGSLRHYDDVRKICETNQCGFYDKYWSCPPGCGTAAELKKKISRYSDGIIVQTVGALQDSFDWEGMQAAKAVHNESFRKMRESLSAEGYSFLPINTGGCSLCKECTYPSSSCRHPDKMSVSMSAYGFDVSRICKSCGIPYNNGPNTVGYIGCFLF